MKALLVTAIGMVLVACSSPVPVAPDMGPIGDGLKVIGFALIGVAVVVTLGRLLR